MLRAIIFDMDGVICDSEPQHMKAFQHVLSDVGITLTDSEYYDKYLAFDDRGCFRTVFQERGQTLDDQTLQGYVDAKARYFDAEMKDHLVIYPGVEPFIKKVSEKFMLALASGARRLEVEFVLRKGKIRGLFSAIVSADDVKQGKPHPESFQTALKLLNERRFVETPPIQPSECLVIEDSIHGLAAAKAAGMKSAAVTTSYKREQLTAAATIIDSFVGYDISRLEKLFLE